MANNSTYPATVDSFTDPTATTAMNAAGALAHHQQHALANDALLNIETLLGTTTATTTVSVGPAAALSTWRFYG